MLIIPKEEGTVTRQMSGSPTLLDLHTKVSNYLDLSEYETRLYVSLVSQGASEARKLSILSGVPRTKVYSTLMKMIERGLVFEVPGYPRKFAPASPAEAFKEGLKDFKERTSEMMLSLTESVKILSLLEKRYRKTNFSIRPRKEDLWIMWGRSDVFRKVKETVSRVEESLDVVTTENGLVLFYKAVDKLIDKLVERGVKVQIRTRLNSPNWLLGRELNHIINVKNVDVPSHLLFLSIDGRLCLLARLEPDNYDVDSGEDFGVFFQNPEVCALVSLLLPQPPSKVLSSNTNEVP